MTSITKSGRSEEGLHGITEQVNRSGEEFGEDRLKSLLSCLSQEQRPLNELLPEIIDLFSEGVPQQDDMSFLLFTYGT